jgi:hypothetical protein
VDSGIFVAHLLLRNKRVSRFLHVLLSEQQLDLVHVWEMKEFAIQLHCCLYTGCGRMDSHISKGNRKRAKQGTKKSFIFSKSICNLLFFPFGFENIIQVAAVIGDALPKPFCKVFHHQLLMPNECPPVLASPLLSYRCPHCFVMEKHVS